MAEACRFFLIGSTETAFKPPPQVMKPYGSVEQVARLKVADQVFRMMVASRASKKQPAIWPIYEGSIGVGRLWFAANMKKWNLAALGG